MHTVTLGSTGLSVSRLIFGSAYLGPIGEKLTPEVGARVLLDGLERGITAWDTAEVYETHPHVACALAQVRREQIVLITKCNKFAQPDGAVDPILQELGTDHIDVLYAHCIGAQQADQAREALQRWQADKAAGKVRALGFTTHSAAVARAAVEWPEVEVTMLPINCGGILDKQGNLEDGTILDMMAAAERAHQLGKGVVAMKVFAAGKLIDHAASALSYVTHLPYVHGLCIGLRTPQETTETLALLDKTDDH
jgi:uncharacterized protein